MARLYLAGAEIDGGISAPANESPDGSAVLAITRDTGTKRTGAASWKADATGANNAAILSKALTFVDGSSYWFRVYALAAAAPTAASVIAFMGDNAVGITANFRTDGALELMVNGSVQGSPSSSIADSTWHRVELKGVATATGNWTAAELQLDGTSVATWSGTVSRAGATSFGFGWVSAPGASKVINFDDAAMNNSAGAANNSWPGSGKVVLLKPTADSAVATGWTNDAAGTTNLFDAVDNTPPVGIADTTSSTGLHQIRDATTGGPESYDATMTTYTAAGINASDTVNALAPWVCTAAPVTTSAVTGSYGVVSNPTIANINFDDTGKVDTFWSGAAAATYGSGWKWSPGTLTDAPTVTLGTAPVARVTKIDSSTRIGMVCFMGIYVDYTPVSGTVYQKAGWGLIE